MKEIIYIQAGNVSNHIGTHFWNTQESYFTYEEDQDPFVDHDISFREGLSPQGVSTFCPRLLLFDHKANFGTLSRYNELYQVPDVDEGLVDSHLWNGEVSEHRQEPIQKTKYQRALEEDHTQEGDSGPVRYWSDYNRVYYAPRSVQKVSDLPDWEASKADWSFGKGVFQKYNSEFSVVDEDLRSFVEECDTFQGFQMMFDNNTFGAFTVAFIEAIRDEYPKVAILTFPVLSGNDPTIDCNDSVVPTVLQDIACIRALNELSTISVPLQPPTSWRRGRWSRHLDLNVDSVYQTSAVLSAHVESTTLPLRLKGSQDDLWDLCCQLNWPGNTKFSHLSGILPLAGTDGYSECRYDFSKLLSSDIVGTLLAQRNTTRGLTIQQALAAETHFTSTTGLREPHLSSVYAPIYPLPSSYPQFFRPSTSEPGVPPDTSTRLSSVQIVSSLTTTTSTAHLFGGHARFVQECVRTRKDVGIDNDELREWANELWTLHDCYEGQEQVDSELGEDE